MGRGLVNIQPGGVVQVEGFVNIQPGEEGRGLYGGCTGRGLR